ncbi:hypothetical protein UR09_06805 [Candidatus Nitromaritima sp. SCGC AAA799-A02]|nr:hypothetical protein UR09_06805 [Candidatus Nitromaritima sp. SCGC AAA799-A02]
MATYTKEQDVETTQVDDPQARAALKEVFGNTARWSADFNGFTADVTVNIDGKEESGTITVKGLKEIEHSFQGEKHKEFLDENMASIAMHRGPRTFEESDGKYKLAFLDDGTHPQGRAVSMGGDGMSSFYRIRDGRIHQINRKTPRMSFTINVEESVKNAEGKYLTRKYTVYYFNPENGSIKDVESYTDTYTRVGSFDLPEYRRIIHAEEGTVTAGFMQLGNHKLL